MKYIKILILSVLVIGCSSDGKKKSVSYYYNLDSLLKSQKKLIIAKKAKLEKSAFVDQDSASNTYEPDTEEWSDELTFFNKMDINKPVLQGAYESSIVSDTKSNLTIRQYIPSKPKSVEVQYFKLYYLHDISNLKKIEALYKEDNPIYKSTRHFTLLFDEIGNELMLRSFKVSGGQKMLLKDTVQFEVLGKIKLP